MKKFKLFGLALLVVMFFASCGGGSSEKSESSDGENSTVENKSTEPEILNTVDYSNFKIGPRDKEYFKMVDGGKTEIVLNDRGFAEITAEFELVKTYTGSASQYFVAMIAKDEKGKTISLSSTVNGEIRSDDSDGSMFLDFLLSEPGTKEVFVFTGSVSQEGSFSPDKAKTTEAVKKIKSFKVKTEEY